MKKVNILYLITKLELGGAQKQALSIISGLDREKFNIFLFTAETGIMLPDAFSIPALQLKRSRWLARELNLFKDIAALWEIYFFIKKNKIEIVHTHSSKAGILGRLSAKLAGVGFICHTVHGWSFNDFQPAVLRGIFILLERLAARFTDKIIVVSCFDEQKGLQNRIGNPDKFQVIRYGINYPEFSVKDRNAEKELGLGEDDLVVGMVSCFKPQKSPLDFVKLAYSLNQSLPSVKFILVGDGILRGKISRMVNELNLQKSVILTGWRRDINRMLSAMDVFVLTSLWEGLPVTVLEAMVSSVPVVVTNTGGVAEVIIEGKTGFLVAPGDIPAMARKLSVLLKDEFLRRQISANAKNSLKDDFTFTNMLRKTQDLYFRGLAALANSK